MAKLAFQRLGQKLQRRRGGRGIREVAMEIGVSAATLSRVERGNVPDLETFAKICEWVQIDPAEVLGIETKKPTVGEALPLITATAHFRADRMTSPELADALAKMIVAAHKKLETEPPPTDG